MPLKRYLQNYAQYIHVYTKIHTMHINRFIISIFFIMYIYHYGNKERIQLLLSDEIWHGSKVAIGIVTFSNNHFQSRFQHMFHRV